MSIHSRYISFETASFENSREQVVLPKVGSCFFWLLKSLLDYSSILAPVEIHCIFEYVADDGNLGETLWYFRSRLLIGINICKEVVICYINR